MNDRAHIPGLPDSSFIRGEVPMTKEEIRALTLCKARIGPQDIVYDIGAGTGSISVEAGLLAVRGKVYAIERNITGIALITANTTKFRLTNVELVQGEAPAALAGLPVPDVVIVGGSGGNLPQILDICYERLRIGGRIIINAVTLETLCSAQQFFTACEGFSLDVTCVAITKAVPMGASHLFRAHNPVYIIVAVKEA
jgi:cobalt-precorrin-6B (C15)-methyltransferase